MNLPPALAQGSIALSKIDLDSSGITNSGSTTNLNPNPVQLVQAPWGLLKLNVLGSNSVKLTSQSGHAKFSEKNLSINYIGKL